MLTDYQDSCSRVSDFGAELELPVPCYLSSQDELCIPQLSCLGFQLVVVWHLAKRHTSRRSSPPLFVHFHHLSCVLLDTGSGCASPLSIDGVTFGVSTWSTSRFLTVQVGQTVLDRYTYGNFDFEMYPFSNCSWMNFWRASSSASVVGYTLQSIAFGTPSFNSIAWSHGLNGGNW